MRKLSKYMKIESIKFKAKCLDNCEWIEGDLIHTDNGAVIMEKDKDTYNIINPFTVCQFTGLKDCEGKEVWEGDIVEFETYDLYKGKVKIEAVIEYINNAYFAITDNTLYSLFTKCIKVIGNKFDKEK